MAPSIKLGEGYRQLAGGNGRGEDEGCRSTGPAVLHAGVAGDGRHKRRGHGRDRCRDAEILFFVPARRRRLARRDANRLGEVEGQRLGRQRRRRLRMPRRLDPERYGGEDQGFRHSSNLLRLCRRRGRRSRTPAESGVPSSVENGDELLEIGHGDFGDLAAVQLLLRSTVGEAEDEALHGA